MDVSIAAYVTEHIDQAISNGWIKVYYQPVIRSLTGQLCGAESLARWIDPEMGFLSPDKFIGALEESCKIHKLDLYMLEQVCADISERIKKNLHAVPVSVNFSRLDFEAVDMLQSVEELVQKYDIPRDYLHIEVTESMIASDEELMTRVIEDFRNAGYEVWMDDFGSGYSSLNLLKDYTFDTLKLDMAFLSHFTDKSKAIMTSTVTMAKNINMMTLAEGVEAIEQVAFLKKIGCDKLQGYYYGKPLPINDFFEHIKEKNIEFEERKWRHYYDAASRCTRDTDEPLEVIEDDGSRFRTLFMNDSYKRQIFSEDYTLEEIDNFIYNTPSALLKKYREFADTIERTRNVETFFYTFNGNVVRFIGQAMAENEGRFIIKGSIYNISTDKLRSKRNSVDSRLKELNHLFEQILLINPSSNTAVPLLGRLTSSVKSEFQTISLSELFDTVGKELISTADYQRYLQFGDFATLKDRVDAAAEGYIENLFRMKETDGNFRWKVVYIMVVPGSRGKEFLVCKKNVPDYAKGTLSESREMFRYEDYGLKSDDLNRYTKLFKNFVANSSVKFFWKDKERRYVGASQAYLNYFGLSSFDDIRGKRIEDLEWVVDAWGCAEDEKEILTRGVSINNVAAQFVIDGVTHNTVGNKAPVYEEGRIIGVMGYFIDVGEELERMNASYRIEKVDRISGIMTVKAFINTLVDYSIQRDEKSADYGIILLKETNYGRIVRDYGQPFANRVLREIADNIVSIVGQKCAVARIKDADFGLLTHMRSRRELEKIADQLKERIESIREVDGRSITLNVLTAARHRSEEGITDVNIYNEAERGLK